METAISIDFGSDFTKIAVRRELNSNSELIDDPSLNMDVLHFCIPTVVARRGDNWVFGIDAVDLKAGGDIEVFRNWKPRLLPSDEDSEQGASSGGFFNRLLSWMHRSPEDHSQEADQETIRQVAVAFFTWLREDFLADKNVVIGSKVRFSVPDFVLGRRSFDFEDILREAGWNTDDPKCIISEPLSNVMGVITAGRNITTQLSNGDVVPNFYEMIRGTGVFNSLREKTFVQSSENHLQSHVILVVDVGAYTSDFAILRLNFDDYEELLDCPTRSCNLGVRRLDDEVIASLDDAKARDWSRFEPALRETVRREVYGKEVEYHYKNDRGENKTIGDRAERPIIQGVIEDFADKIADQLDDFLMEEFENQFDSVRELILTGGGNNIRGIREQLLVRLSERSLEVVHLAEAPQSTSRFETREIQQEIVRGASAMGGASVLFDTDD